MCPKNKKQLSAVVIVQARMKSERLPGKTLASLGTHRMLHHVVRRFSGAPVSEGVMVATSEKSTDDFIATWCSTANVKCFRGSEEDVLSRFWNCAEPLDVDLVVRATADNPLAWEGAVEHLGRHIVEQGCDHVTYTRHMPIGLAVEIFKKEALRRAFEEAPEPHQREHVTAYIYENKGKFDCLVISPPKELEGPFRLTVDTREDLRLMRKIYSRLSKPGEIIRSADAVALLRENPELVEINTGVQQRRYNDPSGG